MELKVEGKRGLEGSFPIGVGVESEGVEMELEGDFILVQYTFILKA